MGLIERLGFKPYSLPLRRPWASAQGVLRERRGWLVWAEADGFIGYGDCAPLSEAGTEAADAAAAVLERLPRALAGCDLERLFAELDPLDLAESPRPLPVRVTRAEGQTPAAHYALACALADLLSQIQGISLRHLLNPAASARVAVNAMLGAAARIEAAELTACIQRGLRVIKLKVGVDPLKTELAALAAAGRALDSPCPADRAGQTRPLLRLDANGAWGFEQARRLIEESVRLHLPIESLEEPLAEPDPVRLAELQSQAPFALALDESLNTHLRGLDPIQLGVRRLVLKPAVIGGLRQTLALAWHAQRAGLEVVLTSLIDSAAGLWPTAQLAGALANPLAHGLGTGEWLAWDLGVPPAIQAGWIGLPRQPGSGFRPSAGDCPADYLSST